MNIKPINILMISAVNALIRFICKANAFIATSPSQNRTQKQPCFPPVPDDCSLSLRNSSTRVALLPKTHEQKDLDSVNKIALYRIA